jgi:hypothetical protein
VNARGVLFQASTCPPDGVGMEYPCLIHPLTQSRDRGSFLERDEAVWSRLGDEKKDRVRPDVDRGYSHRRSGPKTAARPQPL